MGWGVFCYIFGAIAIVGPLILIYWYWKAASQKLREFNAAATARKAAEGEAPTRGPEDRA